VDQPTTPLPPVPPTDPCDADNAQFARDRKRQAAGLYPWWQDPMHSGNASSTLGRAGRGRSTGSATKDGLRRLKAARPMHSFYGAEGRAFRHTIAALFAQGRWLRLLAEMRRAPR
jgi:hypothetical protein